MSEKWRFVVDKIKNNDKIILCRGESMVLVVKNDEKKGSRLTFCINGIKIYYVWIGIAFIDTIYLVR